MKANLRQKKYKKEEPEYLLLKNPLIKQTIDTTMNTTIDTTIDTTMNTSSVDVGNESSVDTKVLMNTMSDTKDNTCDTRECDMKSMYDSMYDNRNGNRNGNRSNVKKSRFCKVDLSKPILLELLDTNNLTEDHSLNNDIYGSIVGSGSDIYGSIVDGGSDIYGSIAGSSDMNYIVDGGSDMDGILKKGDIYGKNEGCGSKNDIYKSKNDNYGGSSRCVMESNEFMNVDEPTSKESKSKYHSKHLKIEKRIKNCDLETLKHKLFQSSPSLLVSIDSLFLRYSPCVLNVHSWKIFEKYSLKSLYKSGIWVGGLLKSRVKFKCVFKVFDFKVGELDIVDFEDSSLLKDLLDF